MNLPDDFFIPGYWYIAQFRSGKRTPDGEVVFHNQVQAKKASLDVRFKTKEEALAYVEKNRIHQAHVWQYHPETEQGADEGEETAASLIESQRS